MKRPTSITIIAALFIAAGGLAAWEIVYGIFHDQFFLNLAVLMIPVGIGLLKGRASSRSWARIWVWFWAIAAGLAIVVCLFFGFANEIRWFGKEIGVFAQYTLGMGFPVVVLLVATWILRNLSSPSIASYFDDFGIMGAANGSQSVRPEANSISTAAGSRR